LSQRVDIAGYKQVMATIFVDFGTLKNAILIWTLAGKAGFSGPASQKPAGIPGAANF
jgi:hypothetical protein